MDTVQHYFAKSKEYLENYKEGQMTFDEYLEAVVDLTLVTSAVIHGNDPYATSMDKDFVEHMMEDAI